VSARDVAPVTDPPVAADVAGRADTFDPLEVVLEVPDVAVELGLALVGEVVVPDV
jgi:hypothetical protein